MKIAHSPAITIGMPVYNGGNFIRQAIESLLGQDFTDFVLIICDDGSTDGTVEVCQNYANLDRRVDFRQNAQRLGGAANFNHVFSLAHTPYFMWAAQDDVWGSSYIRKCLHGLQAHKSAVMCLSEIKFINEYGQVLLHGGYGRYKNIDTRGLDVKARVHELICRMGWYALYGVVHTDTLRQTGLYREQFGGDVLLMLELLLQGEIIKIPEPLFFYRVPNKEKTAHQLMMDTAHGSVKKGNVTPYTTQAREMLAFVQSSGLDEYTKQAIQQDFVQTLSQDNVQWRGEILKENSRDFISLSLAHADLKTLQPQRRAPKAVVFFPHNPYPTKTGAHARCMTMMTGLLRLGYQVRLVSANLFTDNPWTKTSVQKLTNDLGIHTNVYQATEADRQFCRHKQGVRRLTHHWDFYTPPGLKEYFTRQLDEVKPDVVMINYGYWAGLIDKNDSGTLKMVDTHDLITLNDKMRLCVMKHLDMVSKNQYSLADVLREDFFKQFDLRPDEGEFSCYDKFDHALFIAKGDAEIAEKYLEHAAVQYVPMMAASQHGYNAYRSNPVFVVGSNIFNLQGYLYLIHKILPLVLRVLPEFCVDVIGSGCGMLKPHGPGAKIKGGVPDLTPIYQQAKFAICPLTGGTGQQVKIIEAMAHGLPVVTLRNVSESSPIEHGVNGFIANDAREFAEYMMLLQKDITLCRRMGECAKTTIKEQFSMDRLVDQFGCLLKG